MVKLIKSLVLAGAAVSMAVAPVAANAVEAQRASESTVQSEELSSTTTILLLVALAAAIGGIIALTDDSSSP